MTPTISIVFGTLNRLAYLKTALASIGPATRGLTHEIIIVDGGSDDGTLEYLETAMNEYRNLRVYPQGSRLGAVEAFNAGFAMAEGEYVAAFNDDAEYIGAPLLYAVSILESNKAIGQIAIPFVEGESDADPHVNYVKLDKVGRVPYANFSVISRRLGIQLGWWGDYYHYGGDTELSAKVWDAGREVLPLPWAMGHIRHYVLQDKTRIPNTEAKRFDEKWRLRQLYG